MLALLAFFIFFFRGFQGTLCFNSILLSNKGLYFVLFYLAFLSLLFIFRGHLTKQFFFNNNLDFLIALTFLTLFSTLIFFSNNLFSFFFTLELVAVTNFYFISSAREFFFFDKTKDEALSLKAQKKKTFFNVLFFNF